MQSIVFLIIFVRPLVNNLGFITHCSQIHEVTVNASRPYFSAVSPVIVGGERQCRTVGKHRNA